MSRPLPGPRARLEARMPPAIHLQPIIEVASGSIWAYEALARFVDRADTPVTDTLAAAHRAGLGVEVELACVRAALARRDDLPPGVLLTVNVSPDVLVDPRSTAVWDADLHGVVVEVTEHRADDPASLRTEFAELRARGALLAVDDAGTGDAGLLRLASLRPDVVKVDRGIVHGVRDDDAQSAVLEALVTMSHRLGAVVVGEGVERLADLMALGEFDVDYAQGWAVGRPSPRPEAVRPVVISASRQTRSALLRRRAAMTMGTARAQRMHAVTAALNTATSLAGLHAATAQAAVTLGVDVISVSILDSRGVLQEISSTIPIDTEAYPIADYPATRQVIEEGETVEAHVNDPASDAAERAVLARHGHASLLMVPVSSGGRPLGLLEFIQRQHRRWTSSDITHARGLALHVGNALNRLSSR